jgi:hypothetical protein
VLCSLILLVAWLTIGWIDPGDVRCAVLIGVTWLGLTLAFEFLAGHYVFGTSREKILTDYNILRGRVWLLVPLTCFLAPVSPYWVRRTS